MKRWTPGHTLAAGVALIVLTNAVALGGVWWNRSPPAESTVTLSERELGLPWRSVRTAGKQRAGAEPALARHRLRSSGADVVSPYAFNGGTPEWLDGERAAGARLRSRRPPVRCRPPPFHPPVAARGRSSSSNSTDRPASRRWPGRARTPRATTRRPPSTPAARNSPTAPRLPRTRWQARRTRTAACSPSTPASTPCNCARNTPTARASCCSRAACGPTLRDRRGGQPAADRLHHAPGHRQPERAARAALSARRHPPPHRGRAPAENRISAVVQVGQRLEPWISELESVSKSHE